jgi:hypothetical protein
MARRVRFRGEAANLYDRWDLMVRAIGRYFLHANLLSEIQKCGLAVLTLVSCPKNGEQLSVCIPGKFPGPIHEIFSPHLERIE